MGRAMDDLLTDFLTETNESLSEADLALVKLEQEPEDAGTLALIFRLVHTIKGTCGFLGLTRLEKVAHASENVLGKVRDGALAVTPDLITVILAAVDRVKLIVAGLEAKGTEPAGDDSALIASLDAIHEGRAAAAPPSPRPAPPEAAKPVEAPVEANVAETAQPAKSSRKKTAPTAPQATSPAKATPTTDPAAAEVSPGDASPGESAIAGQNIRVGVDVLENLMTLVSELVLTRNQLLQLARSQENSGFTGPLQRLSHITSDLQEGVMKTRMQPIGTAWNKLPRIVRDLSRELGKKIDLVMLGAETELDRQVLELIKDPLTHMVRNSGDHGLESPAERLAAGKSDVGRISLNAFHEGGHIVIEIADDGRGLPIDKIKAKVLSKGLATEAELASMSDEAIQRFIFRAGFSTATVVTAVSGRGVGMDVVKTNIEKIGGTIELKSRPGEGTVFTIKIPLTLAIVSALIVQAGGERFAIPQISVVELVRAAENAAAAGAGQDSAGSVIERINGTPVLRLRERLLPLVSLDELLDLHAKDDAAREAKAASRRHDGALTIIVTQVGASQLGLIVDRVFDTEEIVVKPVAPVLRHISMFSGNTILGDGSVIMILDPSGIARASGMAGIAGGSEGHAGNAVQQNAEALLGADSTAMLLFHAGDGGIKAVPLGLVARLEQIPLDKIETAAGAPVTQYRGRLMRLVLMSGSLDSERGEHPVLVFSDHGAGGGREHRMGLVVDEIVDVVEDKLQIELSGARDGILGTAIIAGHATDVIDTSYWLTQAEPDWFDTATHGTDPHRAKHTLLVVEDSDFFRQMIVPVLQAAGYTVAAVQDAARALALREAGRHFDAIISDIEMPDMDGFAFVRAVRAEGPWADLPVIALSGRVGERDVEEGREAGFTDYVGKFAKDALLASLRQCLEPQSEAADALRLVA
jgi:two-component system chemotaxis sensor kinase CheA